MKLKEYNDKWGRMTRGYDSLIGSMNLALLYCDTLSQECLNDIEELINDFYSLECGNLKDMIEYSDIMRLEKRYINFINKHQQNEIANNNKC